MYNQLPLRVSGSAWFSRRLGSIAIPFLILSVLAHRAQLIDAQELVVLLAVGFLMGIVGIVTAIYAFVTIWNQGGKGFFNAFWGMCLGTVSLLPSIFGAFVLFQYPLLNDVTTDVQDPPALSRFQQVEAPLTPEQVAKQTNSYPDIVPRRFRVSPYDLHRAASQVAERMGWELIYQVLPDFADDPSFMLWEAVTPVFAFKDDVAIRIRTDELGSLLDVRSASRYGEHDFGANAKRIREFFDALDTVLLESYGDAAVLTSEAEEAEDGEQEYELPTFQLNNDGSATIIEDGRAPAPVPGLKPSL